MEERDIAYFRQWAMQQAIDLYREDRPVDIFQFAQTLADYVINGVTPTPEEAADGKLS